MAKITNLITVETSNSRTKAGLWLRQQHRYALFLDFPKKSEGALKRISQGESIEPAIDDLKDEGIYREPEDSRHYESSRTLFHLLPQLHVGEKLHCYIDELRHSISADLAKELFLLTFRARMGDIEPARWKQLIEEQVRDTIRCGEDEAYAILKGAEENNVCLNLPEETEALMEDRGFSLERIQVDRSIKPVDILTRKVKREVMYGEMVSLSEVAALVKRHVEFTELILKADFDQAWQEWEKRQSPGEEGDLSNYAQFDESAT